MDLFSMDDAGGDAAHAFFFFFQLRFSIFSRPASKGQRDLLCSLSLTFACGLRRFTRSREKKRGRVDENAKSEPVSFLMSGSREPRAANGRAFLFFFFFRPRPRPPRPRRRRSFLSTSPLPRPPTLPFLLPKKRDRLFGYGLGIHLIQGEPVQRPSKINPRGDHLSFQVRSWRKKERKEGVGERRKRGRTRGAPLLVRERALFLFISLVPALSFSS